MGRNHVDKVKRFIDNQAFGDAITISHQTTSDTWPIIPSLKIAAKITQKEHTDFHLWLEDDAIAYDISCNSWATTLGSADVGLYANTASKQLINTAYFVSTPEFDLRYSRILDEYKKTLNIPTDERWAYFNRRGSITEYLAYRASREQVYLGPNKVFRHHPHPTHKKTGKMVRAWLKEHIPHITTKDLELTYLDFDD
jgi:hypothetical protein